MKISSFVGGPANVNTYIVYDDKANCVIIDPSDFFPIRNIVSEFGLIPRCVLLTHGHYDHFWGLDELLDKYAVPVYMHPADAGFLTDNRNNMSERFGHDFPGKFKFDSPLHIEDGDTVEYSDLRFSVIHTPGHTAGGVCFLIENCLFTGDTLFYMTVGRTDCPSADTAALKTSIELLSCLDENITVLPGHGRKSTILFEKRHNPFMNGGFDEL